MSKLQISPNLNWSYCECGCHQYELTIAGRHFTTYEDSSGFYFSESHLGKYGKKIKNYNEANKLVIEILKRDLEELKKAGIK